MLLVTADRPPELRGTGANQTINQLHLFGSFTRYFEDLPCPSTDIPAANLIEYADHSYRAAIGDSGGPVHLNCPYREPLAPAEDSVDYADYLKPVNRWYASSAPLGEIETKERNQTGPPLEKLFTLLSTAKKRVADFKAIAFMDRPCSRYGVDQDAGLALSPRYYLRISIGRRPPAKDCLL